MTYEKTFWKDRIRDSQGNIIQEGTPVSAGHLNNMENGISAVHDQLAEQAKETVLLPYGLSLLDSPDGSPLDVEIQGQTLISLGNSELEGGKKYVLSQPNYAVVVNGNRYNGPNKFEGANTKATLIRIADFKTKELGNVQANPHKAFGVYSNQPANALQLPNSPSFGEFTTSGYRYIYQLDDILAEDTQLGNERIAQMWFLFDVIEEVEQKVGKIPGTTIAEKREWLKTNVSKLTFSWYGFGNSPTGNKATIQAYISSAWLGGAFNTSPTTSKLEMALDFAAYTGDREAIDSEGKVHFLAYANASDGVTPSVLKTNFVNLEIMFKSNVTFATTRFPLYEISADEYSKVLVDWDANAVMNRYPAIEGIKSLQNPVLLSNSDNLLDPLSVWSYSQGRGNVLGEYKEKTTAGVTTSKKTRVRLARNGTYTLSVDVSPSLNVDAFVFMDIFYKDGTTGTAGAVYSQKNILIPDKEVDFAEVGIFSTGEAMFENVMLNVGPSKKTVVKKSESYLLAETILRGINNVNDLLYQNDGQWKVLEKWEQIVLDGSQQYVFDKDSQGFKGVMMALPNSLYNQAKLINEQGKEMKLVSWGSSPSGGDSFAVGDDHVFINIYDYESGWSEEYTPTVQEMKDFFVNHPYTLIYQLASPKVIDITNKVEGSLSVSGQTQVSVNSGVVVREKTKLYYDADSKAYRINFLPDSNSWVARSTNKIIAIYKNNVLDTRWDIVSNHSLGKGGAFASLNELYFDENSDYYVTYLALEKEAVTANPVNVLATYNTSIRSTVNQMNEELADVKTLASVHDRYLYKLLLAAKANGWSV